MWEGVGGLGIFLVNCYILSRTLNDQEPLIYVIHSDEVHFYTLGCALDWLAQVKAVLLELVSI